MLANVLKHTVIRAPRRATPTLCHFGSSSRARPPYRVKAECPLNFSFSATDSEILDEKLKISPGIPLVRQGNHVDRAAESIAQDGRTYMTSEDMYCHLNKLENLLSQTNVAGTRLWIDAIFFRASAMLSGNKCMVLNIEQQIPSVCTSVPGQTHSLNISGMIDYAAFITDPLHHRSFIQTSYIQYVRQQNLNGLFVTQAKQEGVLLDRHVPQAVAEMYASAKYLNKGILRGAVTNGCEWVFLIFYLDKDGIGGTFVKSPIIEIRASNSYPYHILPPGPDIVAGIVTYWMEHSYVDVDENDWFSPLK
ncbi:hypothetical protein V8E53_013051 [Lactarius tabidus]